MWTDLVCRLRALFARQRVESELDEELRFHFDRQVEVYRHAGVDELEARRRARQDFGGLDQIKEEYRDSLGVRLIDDLGRDVRLAMRALNATRLQSAVAILSLGLVIGANTAIFSIVNGLLFRALPVRAAERLVHVTDSIPRDTGETRVRAWSYPTWEQIRLHPHLFEAATAWSFTRFDLASGGESQFVVGIWAEGNFFEMLGVPVTLGRTFSTIDDQPGGGPDGPVAVISHGYWQERFAGTADVIGRVVRLSGVPVTIVGVTSPEFFGVEVGRSFDFIVPLQHEKTEALRHGRESRLDSASRNFLSILARLKPGQSLAAAAAELRRIQPGIRRATLGPWSQDVVDRYLTSPFTVVPAATSDSSLRSVYQRPLLILTTIVGLVLLIGCVNIANVSLARTISRRRELSMRLALGASHARLVQQLLVESLTLAAAGTGLGLVIAAYGGRVLVSQLSTPTNPVFLDVSIDGRVLGFAVVITVFTALLFGTAPALRAARVVPMNALRAQWHTTEETRPGVMAWMVVVQVAFSVMLVVAAGLFIRSFLSLTNRDLGLNADPVLVVTIDGQRATVEPSDRVSLYERARASVLALPDVAAAAISLQTPASGGGFTPAVEVLDATGARQSRSLAPADSDVFGNVVSPGWFRTLGTPLTVGRDFEEGDRRGARPVAIVNETFTRRFFANRNPLGQTIVVYPNTPRAMPAQIVGVAADAIYGSPRDAVPATWYMPIAQVDRPGFPFELVRLSVQANASSTQLAAMSVAAAIAEVDPHLALTFRPLAAQIRAALTRERLMAELAGFLGALALVLAGLGLYGVTAHAISGRRTEMAVRIAVGALPGRVITSILARVWLLVGLGVAIGTGLSVWASRFVSDMIYGLSSPNEPTTIVGAGILLCAVGTAAAWLPARRAARMDPIAVLREN